MKPNRTQAALDMAQAVRAFAADMIAIRERESIRPLERRRQHRLAALVALTPFDNRHDCRLSRPDNFKGVESMNQLINGDELAPCSTDLIAQTATLAVGLRVPDGWRVLTGSLIARVAYRYEIAADSIAELERKLAAAVAQCAAPGYLGESARRDCAYIREALAALESSS